MPTFVSVECALIDGEFEAIGVRGKLDQRGFRSTGALMPAELSGQTVADVIDCARRAAAACQTTYGVLHIEIKLTASGPEIVEVNGRVGGRGVPELIRRQTGVDLHALACEIALGLPVTRPTQAEGSPCPTSSACRPPLVLASHSSRGRSTFAARFGVDEVSVNQRESLGDPLAGSLATFLMTIDGGATSHERAFPIYSAMQRLMHPFMGRSRGSPAGS